MAELTLSALVERGLARRVVGDGGVRMRGIRHDSRKLEPGDVFVVIAGSTRPGSELDAIRRGAAAVLSEEPLELDVPVVIVDDVLQALADIARVLYDDPTVGLHVVGITGTNGKTTCSYLVESIVQAAGRRPAVLGTVSFRGPFGVLDATHTTPMADDMMRLSRMAVDSGATHLVLEVSSHGLAMRRVDGVRFEVAAFTNITHDHLDYHGDFESYARAKRRLFEDLSPQVSVLNVDDEMGAALVSTARGRVLRCSRRPEAQAEIRARSYRTGVDGIVAELDTPMGTCTLTSPLAGDHNLENLLVALGCGLGLGLPLDAILDGLARSQGAPGRLERIQHDEIAVFVDYAHTPDALERVLRALRPMCEGRLWCVFGCGGDRDRTKRPLMGGAAVDLADLVIATSDNPRSEPPERILAEIEQGMATRQVEKLDVAKLVAAERGYALVPDRRQAIGLAVRAARRGDVVLIAGKGHEKTQIFADRREPFDDCAEARAALQGEGRLMGTAIPDNRASFTLGELAALGSGSCHGAPPATRITSVCTDTRALRPGCLFVALRGEHHDGHAFVRAALQAGAAAALVEDAVALGPGGAGVVVADTLHALGELARAHRRRWGGRVVAVTGSSGKTTTKELAHAALSAAGVRVDKTRGNLNNLIGAPMTLLALESSVELVVLEIGTSARGEIARLAEIAEPEVGVVTSVAVAHTEGIGTLEQVAEEKAALLWALPPTGTAIYSADHPVLEAQLARVRAQRRVAFGASVAADVRLTDCSFALEPALRTRCGLALKDPARSLTCTLSCLGEGPALDAAAALAVVLAVCGPDALDAAAAGLERVLPSSGRLAPCTGPGGSLVLDDSYNANPASMVTSLHTAIELAQARRGRALLVLGDMRELGAQTRSEHERVGRACAHPSVAVLLACGSAMTAAAETAREAARAAGLSLSISHLADPAGAADLVAPLLRGGDVVLVKGSRSMAMDKVAQALCAGGREAA